MSEEAQALPEPQAHEPAPVAEAASGAAATAPKPARLGSTMPGPTMLQIVIAGTAAAMLLWGTWVTKGLYDLRHHTNEIVKVHLSELVADYVQTTARSGVPTEQAAQQTGTFLKVLNDTVEAHRGQGQVVMLANAIVAGDVPDITEQVRAEVYAKVARPQGNGSGDVQGQMKQFMAANSASSTEAPHGQ